MIKKITLIGALILGIFSGLNSQIIVSEGFETGLINWTNATGNTTNFTQDSTLFHGGSKSVLDAYVANATDTLYETGVVDLTTTTNPQLIFWQICKTESGYDDGKVYISTDSGVTYTVLPGSSYLGTSTGIDGYVTAGHFDENSYAAWSAITPLNSFWKRESFSLTAYTSFSKVKIMFILESDGSIQEHGWLLDDISIENVPCPLPTGLTTFGVGTDTANITWVTGASDTLWQVEYGTTGFIQGTGTFIGFSNADTVAIGGLTPNTIYDYYVRNICTGGDTSSWQGPGRFNTLCITDTIPYLMDYSIWPPQCWDLTGGSDNWNLYTGGAIAEAGFWGISSGDLMMTSGAVHVNAHARVKFDWSHLYSSSYPNDSLNVEIRIGTGTWTKIWGQKGSTFNSNDGAGNTTPGSFKTEVINLDSATYINQDVQVRFHAFSGYGPDLFIDNVIIEEIPSCPEPTVLAHHALFSDSVELNWIDGLADSIWQIQYGTSGFTIGTGTTITDNNDSIAIGGLLPSTTYDVYLRSICTIGDTSIWIGPYTFTTPCSFYTPTYLEDFTTMTFSTAPACWEEATGLLTVASTLTVGTSQWRSDGFGNVGFSGSARMEIWSTGRDEWLLSPSIDLGTGSTPYQIEFDVAATHWSSTATANFDPDDKLVLIISSDNGVTWSDTNILEQWDTGNIPSATGDYFYYNLTAAGYTGKVRFGLYAESSVSGADNNVYIDNFSVTVVPTCPRPQSLAMDSATTTVAYMSWTNGSADSTWIFEYGPVGFTQGTGTISTASSNPTTITGLTASTCYDVYMRSFCDIADTSLWIGPSRVCTDCAPVVDLCEDFEATSSSDLPICWSKFISSTGTTTIGVNTFGAFAGSNKMRMYSGSGGSSAVMMLISPEMTALDSATHRINFWAKFSSTFGTPDSVLIVGTMTDPANPGTFTVWDTINTIDGTWQNYKVNFDTYTGGDKYVAFIYQATGSFDGMDIDEFCFEAIPSCEKPPAVTILNDGVDSNFLNIGWNVDTSFHQTSFIITYGPAGFIPGASSVLGTVTASSNFKSIGGLNSLTEYCFWVRAVCANGDTSLWDGPFCGKTGCAASTPLAYTEDMSAYVGAFGGDILPQCWEEKQGLLGATNTTFTNITSSAWTSDGFGNVGTTGAARMEIWSTGRDEWLISPSVNLGSTVHRHVIVEFDVALTVWNTTAAGTFGDDDTLALVISRDDGVTWSTANIIAQFDTSNTPSNTGTHITLDLPNETGVVKFGFYAASSVSNQDNNVYIDNFKVYDTTYVGIDEISQDAQFKVFPNPNNGIFTILNEGNSLKSNIKIVDIQGRLIHEENNYFGRNGRKVINLNNFTSGVYILLIQSEGKQEQHRLIIE